MNIGEVSGQTMTRGKSFRNLLWSIVSVGMGIGGILIGVNQLQGGERHWTTSFSQLIDSVFGPNGTPVALILFGILFVISGLMLFGRSLIGLFR